MLGPHEQRRIHEVLDTPAERIHGEKHTWGNILSCRIVHGDGGLIPIVRPRTARHLIQRNRAQKGNNPHFFTLSFPEPELAPPQPLPGLHDEIWKRIARSIAEH